MTIHDETNPLHRTTIPPPRDPNATPEEHARRLQWTEDQKGVKDIIQDALEDTCRALDERCDLEDLPRLAQVVYRHDLQCFQVRTLAEPWVVYGEADTPDALVDVMVRQYPKKVPDLPSIPLTPRQRLFLASNTYEDKEAALQELLNEHTATMSDELATLGKQHAKTVKSLRKARADKKRLLAEWQATIDRDSQYLCSIRRRAAIILQAMLDDPGDDGARNDARDFVMRMQNLQDMHNEHVHEVCCLIDELASHKVSLPHAKNRLLLFASQMRELGIAGVPS